MDGLLTPVSTTYLKATRDTEPLLKEVKPAQEVKETTIPSKVSSPDEALEILKNQPDYDTLIAVLRFLAPDSSSATAFHLQTPSPKSAAIVHILVTEIIPNYWTLLKEESTHDGTGPLSANADDAELARRCLRSVTGLNAVITHLKTILQEFKAEGKGPKRPDLHLHLTLFMDLLGGLLEGQHTIRAIWISSTTRLAEAAPRKIQSQQLLSAISSGRILSTAAEAAVVGTDEVPANSRWLTDGIEFSKWISLNVASWVKREPEGVETAFCADLIQRSLSLGYTSTVAKTMVDELLLSKDGRPEAFSTVCLQQPLASKKMMKLLLDYLSQRFLNSLALNDSSSNNVVSAVAGVIDAVAAGDAALATILVDWCTAASGAGLGDQIGIRRAVLAVLAKNKETITTVLEKSLAQFGDQLYIKHAAILQQEAHTQILLLSAGYVARLSPIKLSMLLRSGTYLSAISNRIAATHARARFLGMAVGESLSGLIDNKSKKLNFHMEEMDTDEAEWFKGLSSISDSVGSFDFLLSSSPTLSPPKPPKVVKPTSKTRKAKAKATVSAPVPKAIIEEVDSSDEEEDLKPYAKGSDPEDSDDDATLVQRNKPKAPVYIRDLITYLRDSENYDKQKLALQTAPVLIRRKANYGTEVSSHADELAGLLVGLQDRFDIEDFAEKRQQGMIALVVSQPKSMAPWFARTFFEGDYSLAQRTSILVTIGLSAREVAGYDTSQYQAAASFPSKRLPGKIEQLYLDPSQKPNRLPASQLRALPANAIDGIAQSVTSSFLAPLAAEAADATTGPDVLKLQTFTARYKSSAKAKPRVRAIPNTTAALLSASFFFPLTAHFQVALRSSRPVVLNPALLSLYLQTLGIVVNAAGPSTLSLPQLTSELWDLLLRVRVHVAGDVSALKGWFVAMAVLLEVNDGDMRRLCAEQGREVVETREWVSGVFERTRGDHDGGEENYVKMLAAGVLIKLGEAIEKYQALLLGDLVSFS
ncbi:telomere binding protein [Purpureocillium takamizusanense]|uniref:Telomere binding protein n=1 Tax=Purpureocillium takamizusanense TaxID=2060973 RepID=A0A9Q8V7B2_9HYPO|nr:telomere binding protein [Purpureocillium takamizusanense]UNI14642.1 telomere binding protein [Purpureocillium takamizusanense]